MSTWQNGDVLNATNLNQAFLDMHPIGAIYLSVDSTNPGTLFGGTWEQIKDKFLLTAGDTYTAGNTGGNATHSHKTALGFDGNNLYGWSDINNYPVYGSEINSSVMFVSTGITTTTGSIRTAFTNSVSNLPPYLVVYAWKRTA